MRERLFLLNLNVNAPAQLAVDCSFFASDFGGRIIYSHSQQLGTEVPEPIFIILNTSVSYLLSTAPYFTSFIFYLDTVFKKLHKIFYTQIILNV